VTAVRNNRFDLALLQDLGELRLRIRWIQWNVSFSGFEYP
jgi:hypothetical protein